MFKTEFSSIAIGIKIAICFTIEMYFMNEVATIGLYGFLKNLIPDSYYLSDILLGPNKNFTVNESTQEILPLLVYSNMFLTLIALLITDLLQYKIIIIIGALANLVSKSILFWSTSISQIQVMQILIAVYKASMVAYRTYIYTQVKKNSYQTVTVIVNIAPKMGIILSAIVAQLLISTEVANLDNLMEISLIVLGVALMTSILLPPVEGTAFSENPPSTQQGISVTEICLGAARNLWQEFMNVVTNPAILHWCLWWVLATAAVTLSSEYYVQALWNVITKVNNPTYNAGVEAIYACLSSFSCYLITKPNIDWNIYGSALVALSTLTLGASLICSAYTHCIFTAYCLYIGCSTIYDTTMIISNSQVALLVKSDSFGLVFGINAFLALIVQSVLTYILTSECAFALPIRVQFEVIGCLVILLGFVYLVIAVYSTYSQFKKNVIK